MATNYKTSRQISSYGLNKALDLIGEDPKKRIIHHLDAYYGISLQRPIIHSGELQNALYSMIGSGAEILIQMIESAEMASEFK
jgi:hypothetical protein